ncbi:hypothetical protein RB600_006944 [Gaeumannomyces tritici]
MSAPYSPGQPKFATNPGTAIFSLVPVLWRPRGGHSAGVCSVDPMDVQQDLKQAIYDDDLASIKRCLEQGANVNERIDGQLPAAIAISDGNQELAIFLLRHGTDLSLPPPPPPPPPPSDQLSLSEIERNMGRRRQLFRAGLRLVKAVCSRLCVGFALSWTTAGLNRWRLLPEPVTQHLNVILNPYTPLGVEILAAINSMVPWSGLSLSLGMVPELLVTYSLSHVLRGRPRSVANTLLSWSWSGIFGRVMLGAVVGAMSGAMSGSRARRARARQSPGALQSEFGGLEISECILRSKFGRESLVLTLLELGLLSPDYVEKAVASQTKTVVTKLWAMCAESGYGTGIRALLELGVPVDLSLEYPMLAVPDHGSFKDTALARAAWNHNLSVVRLLLDREADPNVKTRSGTPLIVAVKSRNQPDEIQDLVQLLVENGANVNAVDEEGGSALRHAAEWSTLDILPLLLRQGADAGIVDRDGRTFVHYLCSRTEGEQCLDALVEYLPPGLLDLPDNNGYTPFLRAVSCDQVPMAKKLLMHNVNALAVTRDGQNALQLAARYGPLGLIELLLKTAVKVNMANGEDGTALTTACHRRYCRAPVLSLLLEAGVNPNISSPEGRPIHIVCNWTSTQGSSSYDYSDQLESIRLLVNHGADVNSTSRTGRSLYPNIGQFAITPIGSVAAHGPRSIHNEAIKLLLGAGADPNGLDDEGRPALLALCSRGGSIESSKSDIDRDRDAIEQLLQHGAKVTDKDARGMTCFHHAAKANNFMALAICLSHSPPQSRPLDEPDDQGRTPLLIACADTAWMTQSEYQTWSSHQRSGNYSYGKWHCSLESGLTLRALQAGDADPYHDDAHHATALHLAAKAGNPRVTATLLLWTGSALLYDFPDLRGRLPFHYAARSVEVTRLLLGYHLQGTVAHGGYFDVVEFGEDAFATSLSRVMGQAVEAIGARRAERRYRAEHPDATALDDGPGTFPKPWRAGMVHSPDHLGNTPLHYAALAGCEGVVRLYLAMVPGVVDDVLRANEDGETALDYAYAAGGDGCVRAILEKVPGLWRGRGRGGDRGGGTASDAKEEKQMTACREAARDFVERLGKSYLWGVYDSESKLTSGS